MYFYNFLCPALKLEFFYVLEIKLFLTSASNIDSLKACGPSYNQKLRMLTLLLQQLLFQSMPNPINTLFLNVVPNNDEFYTRVIELGNHKLKLRTLIFTNQSDEKGVVLRHQKSSYMSLKWAYKDLPRLPVQWHWSIIGTLILTSLEPRESAPIWLLYHRFIKTIV
jgi:hypothetical protein